MSYPISRPHLVFLSEEDKRGIHQAALHVLGKIGMRILHPGALEVLKDAGCPADENGIVRIPPALVEKAIQSAPKNILIHDRNGNPAMDLGDDRAYYGTGSDLIYSMDLEGAGRHRSVLDDVRRAARVCDGLPNIDFIMSFAHPSDVPPQKGYLTSFQAMAENSTKPIVCTAEGRRDLSAMWEIARVLRQDEASLKARPYFIHYAEPTSPLKHSFNSLDKLLFCAEKGVPLVYSPAPLSGATAPMTIAGHVAQGLAEGFCGLVIHQLKAEGAPFIMGMGPAVMDMITAQSSYNAPEYYLAYMAVIEMTHYYGLPSWGYAGTSDAQIPDGQATFEAGLCAFLSTMAGANLNHDVGYLDFGLTGSLDMVVIMDEVIDMFRRMKRGIPVDDETLALPVIDEAGPRGDFISHPHTLKHVSDTQWRPKLLNRMGRDMWEQSGGGSLRERARKRLIQILKDHAPAPIPEEQARAVRAVVEGYETV